MVGMSSLAVLLSPKPHTGGAWPHYVCTGSDAPGDRESRHSGLELSLGRGNNRSLSSSPHGCPDGVTSPTTAGSVGTAQGEWLSPRMVAMLGTPALAQDALVAPRHRLKMQGAVFHPAPPRSSLCPAGHQSWYGMVGTWPAAAAFPPGLHSTSSQSHAGKRQGLGLHGSEQCAS